LSYAVIAGTWFSHVNAILQLNHTHPFSKFWYEVIFTEILWASGIWLLL